MDAIDNLKKDVIKEFLTFLNYAHIGIVEDYLLLKNKIYFIETYLSFDNPYPVYEFLKNN